MLNRSYDENVVFVRMNCMRGLLAIVVLLSHIWGYTGLVCFVPFNKMVTLVVACFFCLSGYACERGYQANKKKYLKRIILQKVPFLIYMAISTWLLSLFTDKFIIINNSNYYKPFTIYNLIVTTNWYVYELLGMYLLFCVSSIINNKYRMIFFFGCSLVCFLLLFRYADVEAWYNSIIGFSMGIYLYRENIVTRNDKLNRRIIIAVFLFIMCFLCMFVLDKDTVLFAIIRNIAAYCFIIFVVYGATIIDTEKKFFIILAKYSSEMYFYHMFIAELLSYHINNAYVYALEVIVTTSVLAFVFKPINAKVERIIKASYPG